MKYKLHITSFHYLKFENIVERQAGVTLGIQTGSTALRRARTGNNTLGSIWILEISSIQLMFYHSEHEVYISTIT